MEIINYTPPTSWDDKGMDWDNPDPLNIDYYMAIYEATKERFVVGSSNPGNIPIQRLIKGRPLSTETIIGLNNWIISIAQSYLNVESLQNIYTPTEINALSVFTSATAKNTFGEIACRLGFYSSSYAYPSLTNDNIKEWLKEAKIFLNKLKFHKPSQAIQPWNKSSEYYITNNNLSSNDAFLYAKNQSEIIFNNRSWVNGGNYNGSYSYYREYYPSGWDYPKEAIFDFYLNVPKIIFNNGYREENIKIYFYFANTGYDDAGYLPLNKIFYTNQLFDDSYSEIGKYCSVIFPDVVENYIDFRDIAEIPDAMNYSDIPVKSDTQRYPNCSYGWASGSYTITPRWPIAIYDRSNIFNFK